MSDWTEELFERTKLLWAEGSSASQIARVLGGKFTRNSVLGKLMRSGLLRTASDKPAVQRRTASKPRSTKRVSMPGPMAPMPDALRVPMLKLLSPHCKFPLWAHQETGAPDFLHCGLPRASGPYCQHHAYLCFGANKVAEAAL